MANEVRAGLFYRLRAISLFAGERDGIDVPAIVRLGAVGGATEAEKSCRVCVSAQPQVLDLADAGPLKPGADIAAEIEMGMTVARGRAEERRRGFVLGVEARNEVGTDLVIVLPDHRTQRGADALTRSAEPLHRH